MMKRLFKAGEAVPQDVQRTTNCTAVFVQDCYVFNGPLGEKIISPTSTDPSVGAIEINAIDPTLPASITGAPTMFLSHHPRRNDEALN